MLMKSIPRFISVALVTSFLFSFITPSVYAIDFQEYDYWTYWFVEQSTGVSAEDVKSTDAGISNGEFIASNGGGTRQDAYNWIKDKYDNATNATANGIEYYYNAVDDIYNKSVDYAVQGYYTAENALRKTVDTAGKTVYNVSSSDFWSCFYNQMYNGGGGKDIYSPVTGGNNYDGVSNNIQYTIQYIGQYNWSVINPVDNPIFVQQFYENTITGNNYYPAFFKLTCEGSTYYFKSSALYNRQDYLTSLDSCEIINNGSALQFTFSRVSGGTEKITFNFKDTTNNTITQGNTVVQQPSQMGFIINPLNGDRIPVYTDPSQNPFTINPDGTVDYNGTTYPIYVDPEQISDDGWLWILDYIDKQDNTKPSQNPYGQPWNTQNDGTILGGLFSGLIQDIASLFDKISKSIGDLIAKLVNIITDALKNFLTFLVGDIEGYADLFQSSPTSHFDIVEDLYDLLLQCMGVNS